MRRARRGRMAANIDMVPMIDVVFQLILFFMVSTTLIVTPGISLMFPVSSTAEKVVMTKLVVTVLSRDEIYLDRENVDIPKLTSRLAEISKQDAQNAIQIQKTVVVEADKSVSYDLLIEVLDALRKNGYKGINLRTRSVPGAK
jgi:biopolymer transport protein ExbD